MPDYHSIFEHNNHVLIATEDVLKEFKESWKSYHPISNTHLQYANQKAFVESISYYHGGAPLYTLFTYEANGSKKSIPAIWHECLLKEADPSWKKIPANEVLSVNAEVRNGIPVVVVKNINTNFEYLVSHKVQNELAAKDMQVVFNCRDLQMVALKYGFDLEPKF
ncbi:hypothetical protein GCM10011613_33170 [Cellvibrio zantedeschiae]|uniref:Uncharacterized protein n=1 Tax=Cellvibrio zantedeschiae TaxID=1237077 RepID=A0ABQ3B949_9GAMM|nr:hypothetical protein [Cellvibrio zantedeschiae]GGY85660.1 hypothetical protein GCM10011613_33170 [Cellvibrio zantedeschiae]